MFFLLKCVYNNERSKMPAYHVKYNETWEEEFDGQLLKGRKTKIGDWCNKSKKPHSAYCKCCDEDIIIGNTGRKALFAHAK